MSNRDKQRLREFMDQQEKYGDVDELLEIARLALGLASGECPPKQRAELQRIKQDLGRVRSEMNERAQSLEKKKYGAKFQAGDSNTGYSHDA